MLDYDHVHDAFQDYRALYEPRLDLLQKELAKECAQALLDLRQLDRRIRERLGAVLAAQAPAPEAVREDLKHASATDSEFGRWLAANPNATPRVVARGYTIDGAGEVLPGLETPDEQELRLDTEAFYYKAHRLLTGLHLLPALGSTACKEIKVIRNQLLEHPEKASSGVVLPSFSYTPDAGPIIKGTRYGHQSEIHKDAGYFHNSHRLLEAIAQALRLAIRRALSDEPTAAT